MATLDDVLKPLVEQTESGDLKWELNPNSQLWTAKAGNCDFRVEKVSPEELALKVSWRFYGGANTKQVETVGKGKDIQPLTDLLQEKYPYVAPTRPTVDDFLKVAVDCLTEHK